MKYSVGVEYALHTLFYMIKLNKSQTIGIKPLAKLHNVSESYLSKIFSKLKKSDILISTPGVNGGYKLNKKPENITFWDIIEAIEGSSYLFKCNEIRQDNILNSKEDNKNQSCDCIIKTVMIDSENKMRDELKTKSLKWLYDNVYENFSNNKKESIIKWINENANN